MHFVFSSSSLGKTNVTILLLIGYFVIGHCMLIGELVRYSYFYKHCVLPTYNTSSRQDCPWPGFNQRAVCDSLRLSR